MGINLHLDTAANRIAGKEGDVHALLNGSFQISKHLQRPILIVSTERNPLQRFSSLGYWWVSWLET